MTADTKPFGFDTLALLAFAATVPLYSPNVVPLRAALADDAVMGSFVKAMMAAAIASSAAMAAVSLARPAGFGACSRLRVLAVASCFAGYLGSMAAFLAQAAGVVPESATLAGVAGAVAGSCLPGMAVLWGARLSFLRIEEALPTVCVVCGSTAALDWMFTFLPEEPLVLVYGVLCAAGSLYLLRPGAAALVGLGGSEDFDDGRDGLPAPGSAGQTGSGAGEDAGLRRSGRFGGRAWMPAGLAQGVRGIDAPDGADTRGGIVPRFASVALPSLTGLSLFAFFMGVSHEELFSSVDAEIVGNMAAGAILALVCLACKGRPFVVVLYQAVLPLAAVGLFFCLSVFPAGAGASDIATAATYAFFCMAAQIAIALGIASTRSREFPLGLVWPCYLFLFAAMSAAGLALGAFGFAPGAVSRAVVSSYCAFLAATAVLAAFRQAGPSKAKEGPSEGARYRRRCDELAASCRLSPREREIVEYLGRGHTSTYIAKELVISESTVYTHTRNIYRKIGATSREDVIRMLSEEGPR